MYEEEIPRTPEYVVLCTVSGIVNAPLVHLEQSNVTGTETETRARSGVVRVASDGANSKKRWAALRLQRRRLCFIVTVVFFPHEARAVYAQSR